MLFFVLQEYSSTMAINERNILSINNQGNVGLPSIGEKMDMSLNLSENHQISIQIQNWDGDVIPLIKAYMTRNGKELDPQWLV